MRLHSSLQKELCRAFILPFMIVLSLTSFAQQFEWAIPAGGGMLRYYEGGHREDNRNVVTDKLGNTYIVGMFDGTQDFDPGSGLALLTPIKSASGGVFLAKYDAGGTHLWSRSIASTVGGYGVTGIALDNAGEITVYGRFDETLYYQSGSGIDSVVTPKAPRKLSMSVYLIKYNSTGDFLWAKTTVPALDVVGYSTIYPLGGICTDNFGNLYVAGFFSGAHDFDPGPGTVELRESSVRNETNGYVAKYTSAGDLVWAKGIVEGDSMSGFAIRPWDIVVDTLQGLNEVLFTGFFQGSVDFDPAQGQWMLQSRGQDVFLQKLDSNGLFRWVKQIGGSDLDNVDVMALSGRGNVYISGATYSLDADFDPSADTAILPLRGYRDFFIAKYNNDGEFLWTRGIGDTGAFANHALVFAVDAYENLYCTGSFTDGFNNFSTGVAGVEFDRAYHTNKLLFDPVTPPNPVSHLNFVARYDACGGYQWAGKFVGSEGALFRSGVALHSVAMDTVAMYITGEKHKTADARYLFTDFDPGSDTFQLEAWPDYYTNFLMKMHFALPVSTLNVALCVDGYTLGDSTYTQSGTYICHVGLPGSCDSVVILDLDLAPDFPQPVITVDVRILGLTHSYATYQWLLNGQPVIGATDSTHVVLENGDYRVVVTSEAGCLDTSEIYTVNNVGIKNLIGSERLLIYPNPAQDRIYIDWKLPLNIVLTDMVGRRIKSVNAAQSLSVGDLLPGVYLVELRNAFGRLVQTERIVKM